tara:strand:+ start:135 stop:470 length:336 start_codon:yes stop_codon:yes gene_type:complete
MGELIEGFLQAAENKDEVLSVEKLLTDEERVEWECLVKCYDSIDIMNIGKDLEKITKIYKLNRWQEMSILAYVKILELMMTRAKDAGALDIMDKMKVPSTKKEDYTGGMFG